MKGIGIFIIVCGVISLGVSAALLVYALVQGTGVEVGPSSDIYGLLIGIFLIVFGIWLIRKKK